ncbi:MAG: hypothetical protein ACJ72M_02520, partial [Propionibacteriaceae bacterium]
GWLCRAPSVTVAAKAAGVPHRAEGGLVQPPKSLALLTCWGASVPGRSSGDPLTLATIALVRGSRQILVT